MPLTAQALADKYGTTKLGARRALNMESARIVREAHKLGVTYTNLANEFGVSTMTIGEAINFKGAYKDDPR